MEQFRRQLPTGRDWLMIVLGIIIALVCAAFINLINHARVPLKPEAATVTSPWIPATVKHWQDPIDEMAKKYQVDPNLVAIVMAMESGGYTKANSGEAKGLMQITPTTAKEIAAKHLKKPAKSYNLWDPNTSIEFGAAYLAYLRDTFGAARQGPSWNSTVELIAAGYNGGPGAALSLEQGKGLRDTQTVVYSRDAFNMWRERHAAKSPTYDRWLERGGSALVDAAKSQQQ
jgi:soluble lytic murein transglycosylase-like protein